MYYEYLRAGDPEFPDIYFTQMADVVYFLCSLYTKFMSIVAATVLSCPAARAQLAALKLLP